MLKVFISTLFSNICNSQSIPHFIWQTWTLGEFLLGLLVCLGVLLACSSYIKLHLIAPQTPSQDHFCYCTISVLSSEFLTLFAIDIWDKIILYCWAVCPVFCVVFVIIPGLRSMDASSRPDSPYLLVLVFQKPLYRVREKRSIFLAECLSSMHTILASIHGASVPGMMQHACGPST